MEVSTRVRRASLNRKALRDSWSALLRLPSHLGERDFWLIQSAAGVFTAAHYLSEAILPNQPYWSLHHIPVILYIIPIAYASIRYGWEGGLLTSTWVMFLVLPSIVLWHRNDFMWLAEVLRFIIVVGVGVTLASRVEVEARLRRQAEAVSERLAASEAKFRSLFEAAGDAILVFDRQGSVVSANAAAATLVGMPGPNSLLGQHIGAVVAAWKSQPRATFGNDDGKTGVPTRVSIMRSDGSEVLAEAVVTLLSDGAGQEVFQAVLRDATAQEMREKGLRSLVHQVTQAQEEERERIARELHDDTLQALLLLSRELGSVAETSPTLDAAKGRVGRMAALANEAAEDLRRFSRDLRPSVLNDLGLIPALEWLVEELSRRTGLDAHFRTQGAGRRLSAHVELALFRIAQEALRNIEKHARASKTEITLSFEPARVVVKVTDDGVGFAAPTALEELVLAGKLGLVGLKERARLVRGTLEIRSSVGQGTEILVVIPG